MSINNVKRGKSAPLESCCTHIYRSKIRQFCFIFQLQWHAENLKHTVEPLLTNLHGGNRTSDKPIRRIREGKPFY